MAYTKVDVILSSAVAHRAIAITDWNPDEKLAIEVVAAALNDMFGQQFQGTSYLAASAAGFQTALVFAAHLQEK